MSGDTRGRRPSRRDFLKGLGVTGAGLVAGSMSAGAASPTAGRRSAPPQPGGIRAGHGAPASSAEFGRIFPHLPPFAEANDTVRAALLEVGKPGGILDARRSAVGRPEGVDRRPDRERQPDRGEPLRHQSGQPDDDRGVDVRRPVRRSRHHVRSDLAARDPAEPVAVAQHPHPRARSRLGVRRRTRHAARPVRRERGWVGGAEAEARHRRRARGRAACGER